MRVIEIIEFIKNNITWLKDFVTILFTATGTIVAILTYRRARATVLQPIRNEVIKKQSEILVELLGILPSESKLIHKGLDYSSIATINTNKQLLDLGFLFANQDELVKRIDDQIVGWIYVGERNQLLDVELIDAFEEKQQPNDLNHENIGRSKYENAKKGIIEVDKIYLTKDHTEFKSKLIDFSHNPYLPLAVQEVLDKIISDIEINIHINMKSVLSDFLREFCNKYFTKNEKPNINPIGVYNNFNHRRISHEHDIRRLREVIRKYLMIDEKWK